MRQIDIISFLPSWLDPTFVTVIAVVVIALATVVNVWVSRRAGAMVARSAEAAKRSVKAAEDAVLVTKAVLEAFQRPYLGISSARAQFFDQQHEIHVAVEAKNYGSVPADVVHTDLKVLVGDHTQQAAIGVERYVAFPGETVTFVHPLTGEHLYEVIRRDPRKLRVMASFRYLSVATQMEYAYSSTLEYRAGRYDFVPLDSKMT